MANSIEVYSWPECTLYAYTGATSAVIAYAESVDLQVTRTLHKFLFPITGVGYAARTQYVEEDKNVTMTLGVMYAGASFYALLASGNSGVNISATVNLVGGADGATSTFTLWSAQMPDFTLQGSDGAIWKQKLKIISPDLSGI